MGLFDRLRSKANEQFIEVIDWLDDSGEILVHRFPVLNQMIKRGAQLTVRENQMALFVNEGVAADLFGPGLHSLTTRNIPILTTLKGWKYGFDSPFLAEVYFISTRLMAEQKWGTAQPIMMRDREMGMIRLRAFGTYAFRIKDARLFFSTFVGTRGLTTSDEITGQLRSIALSRFSDAVAEAGISALDLAARLDELSEIGRRQIEPEFAAFGLELARFVVESLSLPEEVQSAIDQRGRLALLGNQLPAFAQLQAAEAMTMAAGAAGGAAAAAMGLGAGAALGQMMGQALAAPPSSIQINPVAADAWSLNLAGRTAGPYSAQEIRAMLAAGHLSPGVSALRSGAGAWAPLSTWPEFAAPAPQAGDDRPAR